MGSCVSVNKNKDPAMKIPFPIDSKAPNLSISSPTHQNLTNGKHPNARFASQSRNASREFGSKEDAFFDSQAWLESDGEDDFVSINGDLTPSHGSSTPNHQRSASGTSRLNRVSFTDRISDSKLETSPTNKITRLSELLKESPQSQRVADGQNISGSQTNTNGKLGSDEAHIEIPLKSSEGSPNSVLNSKRTQSKDLKHEKMKSAKTAQCCLLSLVPNRKQPSSRPHNGG
ncbi:uncharacterized protein At3g27210-like [Magnolia sinica]|uniref:uncharacterized protein At3g27210-like n=1 Tax=Magnolia sinica TaxID=86752 RepID=UPI0026583FBF|nr:uncharacterized protein At3g27210-like [Magnolia sinica]